MFKNLTAKAAAQEFEKNLSIYAKRNSITANNINKAASISRQSLKKDLASFRETAKTTIYMTGAIMLFSVISELSNKTGINAIHAIQTGHNFAKSAIDTIKNNGYKNNIDIILNASAIIAETAIFVFSMEKILKDIQVNFNKKLNYISAVYKNEAEKEYAHDA
jgi:hypothetical protein